MKQTNIR